MSVPRELRQHPGQLLLSVPPTVPKPLVGPHQQKHCKSSYLFSKLFYRLISMSVRGTHVCTKGVAPTLRGATSASVHRGELARTVRKISTNVKLTEFVLTTGPALIHQGRTIVCVRMDGLGIIVRSISTNVRRILASMVAHATTTRGRSRAFARQSGRGRIARGMFMSVWRYPGFVRMEEIVLILLAAMFVGVPLVGQGRTVRQVFHFEPCHEKTGISPMQKQRRRSALQ